MKTNSKYTSAIILGLIALIFAIDATLALTGHTTISACFADGLHGGNWFVLVFGIAVGGLVMHFINSYQK